MRRHGLEVTTQTLWDQIDALAQRLEAVDAALLQCALAQPVIGVDRPAGDDSAASSISPGRCGASRRPASCVIAFAKTRAPALSKTCWAHTAESLPVMF
jgi:hypothetical protein